MVGLLLVAWAGVPATQCEEPGQTLATDSPDLPGLAKADPPAPPRETLDEAWVIALNVDQQLEAKRRGVMAAEEKLGSVRGQRWPQMEAETSYRVRSGEPSFRVEPGGSLLPGLTFPYQQDESFGLRAALEMPLYTWGRIGHGIAAGESRVRSLSLQADGAAMALKLRVAEQYVGVLRAQREVEVAQSTVRTLDSHLRDVEMLYEHAQVPRNDVLAARVALAHARQGTIQAETRLDALRAGYNRFLGRPLDQPVSIAELSVDSDMGDLESLTAAALRNRPETAALAAEAAALRHEACSLRAKNRPQINLRGEYLFEENRFVQPEGIAAAGVAVRWNFFDGGQGRHEAAAVAEQAEGVARLRTDEQTRIALEVRQAWLDCQETRRRLAITPQAIEQAEENLRVARERYKSGLTINTEVLDAEKLLIEAKRDHDAARYDAVMASVRLRYATGELKPD
jgi:outer membrane protein TolC